VGPMPTETKIDVEALRRAHEQHDAELLTSLYADDAESITVDTNNPPSKPRIIRGREDIGRYWDDVMGRGMTHEVKEVVREGDALAYQVACRYDDGTRVLTSALCQLTGGKIARETVVQAWDG
jgi:ketosteroid isomerase-like protein